MRLRGAAAAAALTAIAILPAACTADEPPPPVETHAPREAENVRFDGRASAVTVIDDQVFVADDENHLVHVFDADSLEPVGGPIEVERNPVAMTSHDGAVWVGHATGHVTKIDANGREADEPIRVGSSITGVAIARGHLWAADAGADVAIEIDPESSSVVRGIDVPEGAVRLVAGDDSVWVSGKEDAVSRIDLDYNAVRHVYEVGLGPIGLASHKDTVWVTNSDDGTVSKVTGSDVAGKKKDVDVGRGPIELVSADGALWVLAQDDSELVSVRGGKVDRRVDLDVRPRGIAASEGAIWVAGTPVGTDGGSNPVGLVRVAL